MNLCYPLPITIGLTLFLDNNITGNKFVLKPEAQILIRFLVFLPLPYMSLPSSMGLWAWNPYVFHICGSLLNALLKSNTAVSTCPGWTKIFSFVLSKSQSVSFGFSFVIWSKLSLRFGFVPMSGKHFSGINWVPNYLFPSLGGSIVRSSFRLYYLHVDANFFNQTLVQSLNANINSSVLFSCYWVFHSIP